MRNLAVFSAADILGATPDIHLDDDGNLAVSDGVQSVRERVASRLRFFQGEDPRANRKGGNYFGDILGKQIGPGLTTAILNAHVLDVDGVVDIQDADGSFDPITRTTRYSVGVVDENGDTAEVTI